MTSYLIKIDRRTVRKNPLAGQTCFIEPIGHRTELLFTSTKMELPDFLKNRAGIINISGRFWTDRPDGQFQITAIMTDPIDDMDTFMMLMEVYGIDRASISIKTNYQHQVIHSMTPEPDWLYQYEPIRVKCEFCNRRFLHTELKSDSIWHDDEIFSDTVCPKCDTFDCCEIEYERL